MFKFGVDTWLWASTFEKRHLFCIEEAKRLGAEVIDLSINDPFSFPADEAAELVRKVGIEAVTSTAMPLSCNPISPRKEEREAAKRFMKKLIDITETVGAHVTGGVNHSASGYLSGRPRTQEEIDLCAEHMREVCAYARDRGVTIAMEPVKRFESHFLNTAQQALDLIAYVGEPNLKVHLDTFHMNIEEADIPQAIRACGDKLVHMHLVDSNRGAPGMGHIPWVEVLRAMKDIGFSGGACIETFNPETLDETCMMTYLTRRFADTPAELVEAGLRYLRAAEIVAKI